MTCLWSSADIGIFLLVISNFYVYCILIHTCNFFYFFWVRSGKLAVLDLLRIKVFLNNTDDVINSVHDIRNKSLSRDSNYTANGQSSIYRREVIMTSILWRFGQKSQFILRGPHGSISIIWELHYVWSWIFTQVW